MDGNFILDKIEEMVKPHKGIWEDPFRVLITGIMSTRTRDEVTDRASLRLFCVYPTIEKLSLSTPLEVEKLIKPVGFYKIKSKDIVETSKKIFKEYKGKVPNTMEKLLELPGVGRKVASIVLSYGFGIEALAVDTHVQRVSHRIGLSTSTRPEMTEKILKRKIDRRRWNEVNSYFVSFGKIICRPTNPRCSICHLRKYCKYWRKLEDSS
jgi:endonuclease-3